MFNTSQPAYQALRNIVAERTQSVIIWLGSGLSQRAKMPSWHDLRDRLTNVLREKPTGLEDAPAGPVTDEQIKSVQSEKNNWVAFKRLRDLLGRTTYAATIREAFARAPVLDVPVCYHNLWRLPIRGVITLNIDKLCSRAFSHAHAGRALTEFQSKDIEEYVHVLSATHPFILNAHGVESDQSSWVFTVDELKALHEKAPYRLFLEACLATSANLFVGIQADDVAVGGILERLSSLNCDIGVHYWLTDRVDAATERWAEGVGIRTISYEASGPDHTEVDQFLDDLLRYVPPETQPRPVEPPGLTAEVVRLPDPDDILKMTAEEKRQILNAHAAEILRPGDQDAYAEYEEFCKAYREAIYHSWFADVEPGKNRLMGLELDSVHKEGAFATVYRARNDLGETVAVKLLKWDNRSNKEMLQCFRRGVRSMQILSDRNVPGIVAYRTAYEIPAFVVMDYIRGPDLKEAVEARQLTEWQDVLRIAKDLIAIIRRAHGVPERVLHRDIRPSNIMLKGFWDDSYDWNVVVLDFDLSWHKGAQEVSILRPQAVSGYLAPEQIMRPDGVSTRSAAVDSFGLGMTLLFLRTGHEPSFSEHVSRNWEKSVNDLVGNHASRNWRSVPARYSRVIMNATQDVQQARWDVTQIQGEIERLYGAETDCSSVSSAEMLAEELVARTDYNDHYRWNEDTLSAEFEPPNGPSVRVTGNETRRLVQIQVSWMSRGTHDHRGVYKFVGTGIDRATSLLRPFCKELQAHKGMGNLGLYAEIDLPQLRDKMDQVAKAFGEAIRSMTMR